MNSNNEKLIKIENFKDDYGKIDNIVNALKNGKIIALPTETVYGIFALASDTEALKRIYSIKKRATTKSLTYHLHSSKEIGKFACEVPEYVNKLSEKFLPGPLMILLKKSNQVPEIVTSGSLKVGIRVPNNKLTQKILKQVHMPVVATSANISGRPPAVNGQTVLDELKDEIDMVIEGIEEPYGIESTILDVSMFPPRILRLGFISPDEIASVIGKQPIFSDNTGNISYSRFNPTSEIYVYSGEPQKIQAKIDFLTKEFPSKKILLVLLEETAKNINTVHPKKIYGSRSGIDKIASTLYETIRELENTKEEIIFIEGVPQTGIGLTIMNRFFAISDRTIR